MSTAILSDIRIIDFSSGMAGSVAANLLAELGADVVKIEPPGGSPSRDLPGAQVWNRSKRSVVLDIGNPAQRDTFDRLLGAADALVHDLTPVRAVAVGLDGASLRRFPRLIVSSVGSYPADHPLAETPVDDALVLAQLGVFDEQIPARRSGPMYYRFPLGSWCAAYLAANGLLARLLVRDRGGPGGSVATSLLQGALIPMMQYWFRCERPDASSECWIRKESGATIHECADGRYIQVHYPPPDSAPTMKAALAAMTPEQLAAANATRPKISSAPNFGANAMIFKTRTSDFWAEELRAADIPFMLVRSLGAVYTEVQAQANGFLVEVDDPQFGPVTQPAPWIRMSPPPRVVRPAPRVAEHQAQVLGEWQPRDAESRDRAATSPEYPLSGLKVLDLGMFVAGPLAPMLLAHLGAEVIKVEPVTGDLMRMGNWAFMSAQRDKRCLALNLKHPSARPILERLVDWADVVHHNLRLDAAAKLGLGYEDLRKIKPNLIYSHVSAYGLEGPWRNAPGFDPTVQAASGWEQEAAAEGNPPTWLRWGMLDHLASLGSVLGTLAALRQRERTGEGQFVDASLYGAAVLTNGETMMRRDGSLTPYPRLDAQQFGFGPGRRIYPCQDGWIMLIAEEDGALERLRQQAGQAELDSWFVRQPVAQALAAAAHSGASAVRVTLDNRERFLDDPLNLALRLLVDLDHPHYGKLRQMGAFWQFDDLRTRIERPAPTLGQHSRELLEEFGFPPDQINELFNLNVVV